MSSTPTQQPPVILKRPFNKIPGTPEAYISYPERDVVGGPDEPQLIILCAWMDAKLPHVYKYTDVYNNLYPSATQIIIQAPSSTWWTTASVAIKQLLPVAMVVQDYDSKRVLVHAFSNGGVVALSNLSHALAASTKASSPFAPIPSRAVILDSCPGDLNFKGATLAFTAGIKNPILRFLARVVAVFVLTNVWLYHIIRRKRFFYDVTKEKLIDGSILPISATRSYIYSVKDELVPARAVEEHAAAAKKAGTEVFLERYTDTPHVNHLRSDPQRYLGIIKKTWESGRVEQDVQEA